MARTSDQPLQVSENIDLFMSSLYEAIVLVVLVALIGFWEWRIGAAAGAVDPDHARDDVRDDARARHRPAADLDRVADHRARPAGGRSGGGRRRDQARRSTDGQPPWSRRGSGRPSWPRAIMFATITNIVAYLPLLLLARRLGQFIYSLPVVLTCSLVASRIVSMTFIPLLGLLPAAARAGRRRRRSRSGASAASRGCYYRVGRLGHRSPLARAVGVARAARSAAASLGARLKPPFFPKDLSYLSYVDVWLPEDAPLAATRDEAREVETVIRERRGEYVEHHPEHGKPRAGAGVADHVRRRRRAALLVLGRARAAAAQLRADRRSRSKDKHDTPQLVGPLQDALSREIAGARVDVRQLETGKPVGIPVSIRLSRREHRRRCARSPSR